MTKVMFVMFLVFFNGVVTGLGGVVMGQVKNNGGVIPMRAENWEFKPGAVQFEVGQGGGSTGGGVMKIVDGRGVVILKGVDFADGVIEFDLLPAEKQFASMYFRWKDSLESEIFYFRTDRVGQPQAIQYAPVIGGVNCWNLYDNYQTTAEWAPGVPIHTKLVVSGRRMRVYLNNRAVPALEVPRLEGNVTHGAIAFQGMGTLSNLQVRKGEVEGLSGEAGGDPVANDPHYIRHWQVTQPQLIPKGVDFSYEQMPDSQQVWQSIDVERLGLVNLTRLYPYKDFVRRIVFLKTVIHSDQARAVQLQMGFLEGIWMFLNRQWLYVDKNSYGDPIAKQRGRITIENGRVTVPLRQGDNVLMIGVSGGFYGWGVMARVEELDGITFK